MGPGTEPEDPRTQRRLRRAATIDAVNRPRRLLETELNDVSITKDSEARSPVSENEKYSEKDEKDTITMTENQFKQKLDLNGKESLKEITWDLKLTNLHKYSTGLSTYAQKDMVEYKKFEDSLSDLIHKLGVLGNDMTTLHEIRTGTVQLSKCCEEILLLILNDTLRDQAKICTRTERSSHWKNRFKRIFQKLSSAFPDDMGAQYLNELRAIQMNRGENLTAFNGRYMEIFTQALSFNRVVDGVIAVEDYLRVLPKTAEVNSFIINYQHKLQYMTLNQVMSLLTEALLKVGIQSLGSHAVAKVGSTAPTDPQSRFPRKIKQTCKRCGLYTSHAPAQCIARNKKCLKCGKTGHFAKMCRTKQQRNASENIMKVSGSPDVTDWDDSHVPPSSVSQVIVTQLNRSATFPRGEMISRATDENVPDYIAHKVVGIDSCASISVVNDMKFMLTIESEKRSITLADETTINPVAFGLAQIELVGENGQTYIAKVKACVVPDCKFNLISLHELQADNFGCVSMPGEDSYLIKGKDKLPLKWIKGLLCGKIIPPTEPVCSVRSLSKRTNNDDFLRLHRVLGHVSARTIEEMFHIKRPQDFDCPQCKAFYIKRKTPKPSTFVQKRRSKNDIFDEVFMDIMYLKAGRKGINNYLVLLDSYSRFCFVRPLQDMTSKCMVNVVRDILIEAQKKPNHIITDRQSSIDSQLFKDFCIDNGILLEFVAPKAHQANGLCERLILSLRNKCLAALNDGRLSTAFIAEALNYAIKGYNLTRHSSTKMSPISLFYGREVSLEYLDRFKIFGATCFYPDGKGIFLGFCPRSTSGTIMILNEKENIIRRAFMDCKFDETLLTRQDMPTLWKYFTNKILDIEEIVADDVSQPVRVGLAAHNEIPPKTLDDLINHEEKEAWIEATRKEDEALRNLKSYVLVDRKEVKTNDLILPSRYHWAIKRNGTRKARHVAGGHKQKASLFETSDGSCTASLEGMIIFLIDGERSVRHVVITIDFDSAYIQSYLPIPVYLELPPGYTLLHPKSEGRIIKLRRSLYGLRESGRLWFLCLRSYLLEIGFTQGIFEPCLFVHKDKSVKILIYVDDCLISGLNDDIDFILKIIKKRFNFKKTDLRDFLGYTIEKENGFKLHLKPYIDKTIKECRLEDANTTHSPLPSGVELCPVKEDKMCDKKDYQSLLGKLMWVSKLRVDVMFSTNLLCRQLKGPSNAAMKALKRTMKYLKTYPDVNLKINNEKCLNLIIFADASFANDHSKRSIGGSICFIGNTLISAYSKTQPWVATSTAQAELMEIYRAVTMEKWIRGIFKDFGISLGISLIFTDSLAALHIIKSEVLLKKTNFLATKIKFIQAAEEEHMIKVVKIAGTSNPADVLTKVPTKEMSTKSRILSENAQILGMPVNYYGQDMIISELISKLSPKVPKSL